MPLTRSEPAALEGAQDEVTAAAEAWMEDFSRGLAANHPAAQLRDTLRASKAELPTVVALMGVKGQN